MKTDIWDLAVQEMEHLLLQKKKPLSKPHEDRNGV
jgi:hypothetical protein